jgi:glycosyltransferase involved in cell wall biosynthesis
VSKLTNKTADARAQRMAFVSDVVYPFHIGGKETRLYEISRRLAREGREVHIYTMNWWGGEKTIRLDGVWLHAISKLRPIYKGHRRSTKEALLFGLATLRLLTKPFDSLDVDSMPLFPLFSARLVCALRRKRMLASWHEVWGRAYWREYMGVLGILGHATESWAFRMPHEIISNSEHTTERLRKAVPGLRIRTVPLGVDFEGICLVPAAPTQSDVIFAGRLLINKNVDFLLRALALIREELPGIRCIIVGQGPERVSLEELARSLSLSANVTFLDFLPNHDDLFGLMKSSKVFVLPSEREGFGVGILEANACGLPAVTVRHPSNAAQHLIVHGENGFVTDLKAESLAAAILKCLDSPDSLHPEDTVKARFIDSDWSSVTRRIARIMDGTEEAGDPLATRNSADLAGEGRDAGAEPRFSSRA